MFNDIHPSMLRRMRDLELIDLSDRSDGTPHLQRLRQIPSETGQFLAILAASAPEGSVVEIGTSAGYSTMWLSLAGRQITTFEILPDKAALARETFRTAQIEAFVDLVEGDARDHLAEMNDIAFGFLDAEKDVYEDCYDLIVPRLVPGGLLVADNVISHREELQPFVDRATSDPRVDAVIVPIGKGELVCRKT
jgi:caffeoyl-CoA O-methyltransferase